MKIVIIGGGFAGINLAKELVNFKGVEVILVDKNNYNFFPPLIYQVATAFLEPSSISYPFRKFFSGKKNLKFRLGELLKVNQSENTIILSSGGLHFDKLVFATLYKFWKVCKLAKLSKLKTSSYTLGCGY
jgi:NADH dehydrogenase